VYSINTTVCEDAVAMVFDLFGALPSGVLKPSAVRGRRT
jgi:hypothetical protein